MSVTVPRFGYSHHSKINKLDGIIIIITDLVLSNKKQLNPLSPAWYFRELGRWTTTAWMSCKL